MLNVPNFLTVLRIALTPVFAWSLFSDHPRIVTLILFLVAALTDLVDGWWARKYDITSDFGKIADPIADKALTGAAWIGLSMLGDIPVIATVLIVIREVGITVLRLALMNRRVLAADRGGKWKTTLQIVTISFYVIGFHDFIPVVVDVLLWATVLVTSVTGLRYVNAMRMTRSVA
ncbi:MAG: hypothetical protein RIS43_1003 [Actinomycetota bacterium]|jgi:CDP-diacylglycerol--glycerol-3-phosphate 3-phosphatidyltransferase